MLGLALAGCGGPAAERPAARFGLGPEDVAQNNRGVGLMEHFDFAGAHAEFSALVEAHPDWTAVRVNLAIATLNRQQPGDEDRALALVNEILAGHPGERRSRYLRGLLELHAGDAEAAGADFEALAQTDSDDAYAAYYLAQTLFLRSQPEQALAWYRRAIERDAYLRSAHYGAFQTLQRLGRRDEAASSLEAYQRLDKNPRAHLAELKYTRMGPLAEATTVDVAGGAGPERPGGPPFEAPRPLDAELPAPGRSRPALAAADLDDDGRLDLVVSDLGQAGTTAVLMGEEGGTFRVETDHALSGPRDVHAAVIGDYDNDGRIDVYLCRRGRNVLFHQDEAGRFTDVTASTGTAQGDHDSVDGLFVDADHDGDLDLFVVNADGPNELLNNDLDGRFRPLAVDHGLAEDGRGSRSVVAADLDQDRDVDLFVVHDRPPHEVFLNDRLWRYSRAGHGFDALRRSMIVSAVAADANADGAVEIYALDDRGEVVRYQADRNGTWVGTSLAPGAGAGSRQLAVLDLDGDGKPEVIRSTPRGWQALRPEAGPMFETAEGAASWLPVLLDPARGPAVVALGGDGLRLWGPGTGRHAFLALALSGRQERAESIRSNASGVGASVAIRAASRWSVLTGFRSHSGPGQSQQPQAIGLGGAASADFVRIEWSDGVSQSELGLAAGQVHRIAETQRQTSSCPVLFAWDGSRFAFVTDFLGVGGLGYNLGAGEYSQPRPRENLLLPPEALAPRDGRYVVKLTEPMEEAAYVDSVELVAYDLPAGWDVVLDERMGTGGPEPSGAALFFRRQAVAERVVNDRGQDVTDSVARADLHAAPPGPVDRRFIGRLIRDHQLTLRFAQPLDGPGRALLVMDGWIEYPYSQTSFAAWQAGAEYRPPSLEARGPDGRWHVVLEQFGYPAGMPRRAAVPLDALPPATRELRLTTNQEIYWDRLAVVWSEPLEASPVAFPLAAARLSETGFARRSTGPQRQPRYDYDTRAPLWDTRHMAGWYTAFGPVGELLASHDDAVAIYGPGEEIEVAFDGLPGPAAGFTRRFVLQTRGWAKDRDLLTRDGETVGPLPSSGQPPAVRDRLHARYNTRFRVGG